MKIYRSVMLLCEGALVYNLFHTKLSSEGRVPGGGFPDSSGFKNMSYSDGCSPGNLKVKLNAIKYHHIHRGLPRPIGAPVPYAELLR